MTGLSRPQRMTVIVIKQHKSGIFEAKFRWGDGVQGITAAIALGRLIQEAVVCPSWLRVEARDLISQEFECRVPEKVDFRAIGEACLREPERFRLEIKLPPSQPTI
ncbi:MAG: hypothetical protein AAB499_01115 [Patescibacteria group bacterium]